MKPCGERELNKGAKMYEKHYWPQFHQQIINVYRSNLINWKAEWLTEKQHKNALDGHWNLLQHRVQSYNSVDE